MRGGREKVPSQPVDVLQTVDVLTFFFVRVSFFLRREGKREGGESPFFVYKVSFFEEGGKRGGKREGPVDTLPLAPPVNS